MNYKPVFANTPISGKSVLSVANTSMATVASPANSTSFGLLLTAATGSGGVIVPRVNFIVVATSGTPASAAAILYIWITDNTGANATILYPIQLASVTAINTTAPGQNNTQMLNGLILEEGQSLYCSITALTANTQCNVTAFGGTLAA